MTNIFISIFLLTAFFTTFAASQCASYGCSNHPLDIKVEEVENALKVLKSPTSSDIDKEQALAALALAGNKSQVTMTLRSYKAAKYRDTDGQINQDAAMIYSPFLISGTPIKAQISGVFDGHGKLGEVTAYFAAVTIPNILSAKLALVDLEDDAAVTSAIQDTFLDVNVLDPAGGVGGCTATMVLKLGEKVFMANAGDSTSFLAAYINDQVFVIFETRKDLPSIPSEMERIIQSGGSVLLYSNDVARAVGAPPNDHIGLEMSRDIGDWENNGVTAEPLVNVFTIEEIESLARENLPELYSSSPVQILAVSASDGILDVMNTQALAELLTPSFFTNNSLHPILTVETTLLKSKLQWDAAFGGDYSDDITLAAITLQSSKASIQSKEAYEEGFE